MNFELKIRKSEMLIFLLLLPLYRPPYLAIAKFSYMDAFFVYGKIVSFAIAILIFGSKIQKKNKKKKVFRDCRVPCLFCMVVCVWNRK